MLRLFLSCLLLACSRSEPTPTEQQPASPTPSPALPIEIGARSSDLPGLARELPKVKGAARKQERRAVLQEAARLHVVLDGLRENGDGDLRRIERCAKTMHTAIPQAEALEPRVAALDPADFELLVAVGELALCVRCSKDSDFFCNQVSAYLKKQKY